MTETQRNIQNYKSMLPGLKEKVMAAAMLLLVSMSMVVSASFAWITLSRAPEVANVTTNIAANGNLEIALADTTGQTPGESKVGDSSAAEGQDLTAANITWGNLVNLSDPSYGLSNIVLRPALLSNASNLLDQPLKGANYGDDGRMELYYNEDFQFTNWTILDDGSGRFEYLDTPRYGVRAISTIKYEYTNDTYYKFVQLMKQADNNLTTTNNKYNAMIGNDDYIDALAALIGQFMTDKLNDSDTDVSSYMDAVYNMMLEFEQTVLSFEDVLVTLANTQVYNYYGPSDYATYTYTKESFRAATDAELKANGVSLTSLAKYRTILSETQDVLYGDGDDTTADSIQDFYYMKQRNESVMMSALLPYVNRLVNINACQIILTDGTTYTVGNLGMSAATQLLGKDIDAKITKGVLKDFEQLTGCKMCAVNVNVKAKYIVTVTMTAKTITTTATDPYQVEVDMAAIEQVAAANKEYKATAQDTYGMAIDFWVRTNATNSYLVLEGNVLTKTETVRATGVDLDGNTVSLYTITVTTTYDNEDGTSESFSEDVAAYQRTETQSDNTTKTVWRNANDHSILDLDNPAEGQSFSTPKERLTEVSSVIGYEGENRVWDDNMFLDTDSTTQGGGSCYIFYAEDPGQQEYCLRLLSNLRVAFLDANEASATYGKMVAIAKLDIDNRFEENGKVTLPLVLMDDGSNYLTKYENGLAITELEKNVPSRLTAIVFLDGREITNADVLAANDIQGQLNLQFGSTVELTALEDEALQLATRSVSMVASKDSSSYPGSNSTLEFAYESDDNLTVYVKMDVEGEQPNSVSAFFMRKVNATQGSRETSFTLTQGEDGSWYGMYTFSAPGEYVLRTVQLDGQDYTLPSTDGAYPHVTISGFLMENVTVSYSGREITELASTIMTGDASVSMDLSLSFKNDQKRLPGSVRLQFLKDDGTQVTTTLTYNATTQKWTGTANFTSSGVYTLRYVIMDGEYTELPAQNQRELTMYVGMTVQVTDTGEYWDTLYEGSPINVPVTVEIYDNTGAEVRYLSNAKLVYVQGNSNVDGMNPDLKWNSSLDCYTTTLQIRSPGIYTFDSVKIGSSVLKKTVAATPVYTCMSPETPTYYDAQPMEGKDYLLSAEVEKDKFNVLTVGVRLADAESATVTAVLVNKETSQTYRVSSTAGTPQTIDGKPISPFEFELPRINGNYQSGDWEIRSLELINVFSKDENDMPVRHTADNPYILDLTQLTTDDLAVKVVNAVVEVTAADEDLDGGGFMGTATAANPITVKITDHRGEPLDENYITVKDMSVTYMYTPQSSQTYGHYIQSGGETGRDNIPLSPESDDGMNYVLNKITLDYAGEYLADVFTFKVSETSGTTSQTFTYTSDERSSAHIGTLVIAELPRYTLTTAAPTVKVTGTNPAPGTSKRVYTVNKPSNTGQMVEGDFFRYTDYSAAVYIYTDSKGGDYDQEAAHAYTPTVTLKLSGVPTGATATMSFTSANTNSVGSIFTFGTDFTATATIGRAVDGSESWTGVSTYPESYPAGKMTQRMLTVVYNNVTYDVTLPETITIDQPQSPTVLTFTGIPTTYTGTKPAQVVGNGTTVTVTLPKLTWTAYTEEASANATWTAYSAVETNADYRLYVMTERTEGNWVKTYYRDYQYYDWTTFRSSCTDTITYYTQDMQILKWVINGVEYSAGQEISITAEGLINAVAVVTEAGAKTQDTNKEPSVTTTYRYQYGYVTGSEVSTRKVGSNYYVDGNAFNGVYSEYESYTLVSSAPTLAVPSTANAGTDPVTVGTGMTTDPDGYINFMP